MPKIRIVKYVGYNYESDVLEYWDDKAGEYDSEMGNFEGAWLPVPIITKHQPRTRNEDAPNIAGGHWLNNKEEKCWLELGEDRMN